MIKANVRPAKEGKTFELFLSNSADSKYEKVLGSTKLECDAQMHMHAINEALEDEFMRGYDDGYGEGERDGYDNGYEDGRSAGYDDGYDAGVEAGKESE